MCGCAPGSAQPRAAIRSRAPAIRNCRGAAIRNCRRAAIRFCRTECDRGVTRLTIALHRARGARSPPVAFGFACRFPGNEGRVSGPDPHRGSYASFLSFADPDANTWLLQEVTTRAPGRVKGDTAYGSAGDLSQALRRAAAAHGEHEARTGIPDGSHRASPQPASGLAAAAPSPHR